MDCVPFKIPSHTAGDFSYYSVIYPFGQKVTLHIRCLLVNVHTALRLATNFLRGASAARGIFFPRQTYRSKLIKLAPIFLNGQSARALHFADLKVRVKTEHTNLRAL